MICILHSGGIDSTAVVQYYVNRAAPIQLAFVDYGQVMASTERAHSENIARFFGLRAPVTLDVREIGNLLPKHPLIAGAARPQTAFRKSFASQYFPNRNLLLLVVASIFCFGKGYKRIALGILGGGTPSYADTDTGFLTLVNLLFSDSVRIDVSAPLLNWSKQRVVSYLRRNGFDLARTFSCNVQATTHCGTCASCVERNLAIAHCS